jgi:metallophosphoesterase (TIGR03768 family)
MHFKKGFFMNTLSSICKKMCVIFAVFFALFLVGCSHFFDGTNNQPPTYPISSIVLTTLQRTIEPDILPLTAPKVLPYEVAKYKQYGYGSWQYGPGLSSVVRYDIMPREYVISIGGIDSKNKEKSVQLLQFFTITDIHITDKESPAQAILAGYKGGNSSAYSPIMLYTTHVLDAAVQTINALHKQSPFDFGISLGDTCNATQYNELRWYIDVLDGKKIAPSSGEHVGADSIDYQKPYKAAGLTETGGLTKTGDLDTTIPWYQVLGNHDHFWMGFLPANDYIRNTLIGDTILNLGNPLKDPLGADSRGFYMGSIDGRTPYGDVIGAGPIADFAAAPKILAADKNRRSLKRSEWIAEFFNTASKPVGHGFSRSAIQSGFACYAFEPKVDVPLKVIVLDDTQRDDDPINPNSLGYGHGSLDAQRYDWLVEQLDAGQKHDQLMIIAAHIPIGDAYVGTQHGWERELHTKLIAKLHTYPNLILWIAGHRHQNTVTPFVSPDVAHPEYGFWQVETSALRDFPQQFRTFTIMLNPDNTISIITVNVDPAVQEGSPAAKSRSYGVATQQIFKNPVEYAPSGSYNAELVKQLTPSMQQKMQLLYKYIVKK